MGALGRTRAHSQCKSLTENLIQCSLKIVQSQNNLVWKLPLEVSSPTSWSKHGQLRAQTRLLRALPLRAEKPLRVETAQSLRQPAPQPDWESGPGLMGKRVFLICSVNLYCFHLPFLSLTLPLLKSLALFSQSPSSRDKQAALRTPETIPPQAEPAWLPQHLLTGQVCQAPAVWVALC